MALVFATPQVGAQTPVVSLPEVATSAALVTGAEVPPPGFSVGDDVAPVALPSEEAPDIPCSGDGVSGPRVEVL